MLSQNTSIWAGAGSGNAQRAKAKWFARWRRTVLKFFPAISTPKPAVTRCLISCRLDYRQGWIGSTKSSPTQRGVIAIARRHLLSGPDCGESHDSGGFLALLLPVDFDSAVTRTEFFHESHLFLARIILTARPVWFERADGRKPQPKENVCWFIWARPVLRVPASAVVRYALSRPPKRPQKRRVFCRFRELREGEAA